MQVCRIRLHLTRPPSTWGIYCACSSFSTACSKINVIYDCGSQRGTVSEQQEAELQTIEASIKRYWCRAGASYSAGTAMAIPIL